jgi:hypothetical protein
MPHTIALSPRSATGFITRMIERLSARWGWLTGRVPSGVTPTLPTSRHWFH